MTFKTSCAHCRRITRQEGNPQEGAEYKCELCKNWSLLPTNYYIRLELPKHRVIIFDEAAIPFKKDQQQIPKTPYEKLFR